MSPNATKSGETPQARTATATGGSKASPRGESERPGDRQSAAPPGSHAAPRGVGGVQISPPRKKERRTGHLSAARTERESPFDPPPDGAGPADLFCAYGPCAASLAGKDARARFCCRDHKEADRKRRRRAEKSAGTDNHQLCDVCGRLYLGRPPTCPTHTESPMKGTP